MLTGFIGDIHGNVDALEQALETLRAQRVERIICTGDIVGYGACPRECIDLVRQLSGEDFPTSAVQVARDGTLAVPAR